VASRPGVGLARRKVGAARDAGLMAWLPDLVWVSREERLEQRGRQGHGGRGHGEGPELEGELGGCGGSGCSGERESARERARGRSCGDEAQARGRRRVREIRTLNKPYGFGC